MIHLRIPKDPTVLLAVSAWLAKQAGAPVHTAHDEALIEAPRVSEQDIRQAMLDQVLPPATSSRQAEGPGLSEKDLPRLPTHSPAQAFGAHSAWQAAGAHPGDIYVTAAQAFGTPPPPVTGGSVNINAPSPGPDVGEFGTEIHNVHPALDGRGYPWDDRIHSESKALLAKAPNGWKLRRGVDPALVEQVEAELRAQGFGAPKPAAAVIVPPPPVPTLAASFPASEAFPAAPLDFPQVMARIGGANKLTEAQAMLAGYNLPSFPALAQRPDLWQGFLQALGV